MKLDGLTVATVVGNHLRDDRIFKSSVVRRIFLSSKLGRPVDAGAL